MGNSTSIVAAVGAVILRGDDVLLIQRARAPFQGHWSIPGGKIDHGEPHLTALAREVLEETGVTFDVLGLIGVFEALPDRRDDRHFLMIDYAGEFRDGTVRAGDDAMDAGFFPLPEALSRLSWDKTRQAVQGALAFRQRGRV